MKPSIVILLVIICGFHSQAWSADKPVLLIVGTAHFDIPGKDLVKSDMEDILNPRRQREIESAASQLAKFNPTHVAVEVAQGKEERLNVLYQSYIAGKHELTRNEVEQLGFRVAKITGLMSLQAVDWNGNPPGDAEADYNWYDYGLKNGFADIIEHITSPEYTNKRSPKLKDQTISQWLVELNSIEILQLSHQPYFEIAKIGKSDNLIGANWVGTWYARNLKIFTRLAEIAKNPDSRVLVIYGQGHAYLLRQFALESGLFEVEEVGNYLH